ncbi:MAG: DUF393 domain-containing protein [bacterium]|nr:DUF393 domain-containing protein [bacterium]
MINSIDKENGWTGGQYSLFRFIFGIYLYLTFTRFILTENYQVIFLCLCALLSLLIAFGKHEKLVTPVLLAAYVYISNFNEVITTADIDAVAIIFIISLFLEPNAIGSWNVKSDSINYSWRIENKYFKYLLLGLKLIFIQDLFYQFSNKSFTEYSEFELVIIAAELAFIFCTRISKITKLSWTLCFLTCLANFNLPVVLLAIFIFNPHWIPAIRVIKAEIIFYDGPCGLCHRLINFVLSEDRESPKFKFSPIQSSYFEFITGLTSDNLSTVYLLNNDDKLLTKGTAIIYIMERLGGFWRILGILLKISPRIIIDMGYTIISKARYSLFERTQKSCPNLPHYLHDRFN